MREDTDNKDDEKNKLTSSAAPTIEDFMSDNAFDFSSKNLDKDSKSDITDPLIGNVKRRGDQNIKNINNNNYNIKNNDNEKLNKKNLENQKDIVDIIKSNYKNNINNNTNNGDFLANNPYSINEAIVFSNDISLEDIGNVKIDNNNNNKNGCYADYNKYKIQRICFVYFLQNLFYLFILLFIFEREEFRKYIKFIFDNYPTIFISSCFISGAIFLIIKYIQCKSKKYRNRFVFFIFILCLTFFKAVFYFQMWALIYNVLFGDIYKIIDNFLNKYDHLEDEVLNNGKKVYFTYFSFSAVYHLTLCFFLLKKGLVNSLWLFLFGLIYLCPGNIYLYYINYMDNYNYIYGIVICLFEILYFNLALNLALFRNALDNSNVFWNFIHIEIYKIYPILFIFSIPSLPFLILFSCIHCICC